MTHTSLTALQNDMEHLFHTPDLADCVIQKRLKTFLSALDQGEIRVATYQASTQEWTVNEWVKQGILSVFKHTPATMMGSCYDKIPLKTRDWQAENFTRQGVRVVPGSVVRLGAYLAPQTVVMPSFINIGAYVDGGTMIDSYATVGSCAQIGKRVHVASQVVIGGVLEPVQAHPVIIEDDVFIGAGSHILEGVHVQKGAVISSGVSISQSTKIIDRETGKIYSVIIPPYSVVVSGSYTSKNNLSIQCAVIVKTVDESTRFKTQINDLLRDH